MRLSLREGAASIVIVALLALGLLLRIGPDVGGTTVGGEVIGKREAIDMPLQDTWRHLYEISYRYRPLDAPYPTIGQHHVDVALFDRLRVGSRVRVRYRQLPIVGAVFGPESALAASSWWSRVPLPSEWAREMAEVVAVVVAALLGFIAYRRNSRVLGLIAVTVGVTVASSVLLLGFLLFPILFWVWRANPGKGFGWALLLSMVSSTVALYERVPQPARPPSGPQGHAKGVVRGLRTVDQIWASWSPSSGSIGGQGIGHQFQMIDVEFTPAARAESVHALDRVDLGSIPGLREGSSIPVTYPIVDPRSAWMSVGTRTYGRRAWLYILALTYGIGATLAFVVFPAVHLVLRWAPIAAISRVLSAASKKGS